MYYYSTAQLKRAIQIQRAIESFERKIESLKAKVDKVLGGGAIAIPLSTKTGGRKMSAAAKARIAAAQRARWAKLKGNNSGIPVKQGRRKMSAAVKARLAEVARKRWAKVKAAGKTRL